MNKVKKIGMAAILMAITGYGAWSLYKKYNPECMEDMEEMMTSIGESVEKSINDMK